MEQFTTANITIMKTYNYFYGGQAIPKQQFLGAVPEDWEKDVDEYGEYSYGYYRAVERDDY